MEKATDKWFKDHGWKKTEEKYKPIDDQPGYEDCVRHHIIYDLIKENMHAQVTCTTTVIPAKRWRKKSIERFYTFWATGNNLFEVKSRISYFRYPVETIENALKVVGYKEEESR